MSAHEFAPVASRRSLLRFLLGSPLLLSGSAGSALEWLLAEAALGDTEAERMVERARDAVTVLDFQPVAKKRLSPAHYTYLSMGVGDEFTLRANRVGFERMQLLPRRLVDVREVDTSSELLGQTLRLPIGLAPVGSQRTYHEDAELAVARAAKRSDNLQILSMGSSTDLDDVVRARGSPVWYQLYGQRNRLVSRHFVGRAESAGCPAIVLTVDVVGQASGRERIERFQRDDNPDCQSCHSSVGARVGRGLLAAAGILGVDVDEIAANSMILDWDVVDRIRDATDMNIVVKGILSPEDARLCVEHGVDAVVVSNHGGRAEDNGLSTIEVLPQVVAAVDGRIPVLVDSGFRRGSDVFKALALGASAVLIGRPYVWGLAAFGQDGVEAVLDILRRELEAIMRQMGTPDLASITSGFVRFG